MNKKLLQELQKGEAVLQFTLGDDVDDLKAILKKAFPLDETTPRGEFRYYGTFNPHSKQWDPMEEADINGRKVVSVVEIMDDKDVYWKMRNGTLINVDDMDVNHMRNVLKGIIRENEKRKRPLELSLFDKVPIFF